MRRIAVFFASLFIAAACSLAVGAWGLPAGQAAPPLDGPAIDVAPVVDRLEVSTASVEPAPVAEQAAGDLAVAVDPPGAADHLLAEGRAAADRETPEPIAIVTTTTVPPTTTTRVPVATVAFRASQAYGSCGEEVPYDIFSGTATPGSTITISSPYGSGSATADGYGHWERTVEFPGAPSGETFAVTASGLGGSKTFQFTATGGVDA